MIISKQDYRGGQMIQTYASPYVSTINTIELFQHIDVLSDEQKDNLARSRICEELKTGNTIQELAAGKEVEITFDKKELCLKHIPPGVRVLCTREAGHEGPCAHPSAASIVAVPDFPPIIPPPEYLDGRKVWKARDGSTWRYNQGPSKKWVRTS